MQCEIWKDCYGYEGLYLISNYGSIKSCNKKVWNRFTFVERKGKIMKTQIDRYGYVRVTLCKNGKRTCEQVHRLVALTFIPNLHNLSQINHKDLNKKNNYAGTVENNFTDGNLEWCTNFQNMKHARENLDFNYHTIPVVKIDIETNIVLQCFKSIQEAATNTGTNPINIWRSCHFDNDSASGFRWRTNENTIYKIGDYINLPKLYHPSTSKRSVAQIKDGIIINIYESIMDAARDNNCTDSSISMCCKGKIKQHHGFEWKYYNGDDMIDRIISTS